MKPWIVVPILLILMNQGAASAATPRIRAHGKNNKLKSYGKSLIKRRAFIGAGGSAVWGEMTNRPHEWGRGPTGVAKRFGSGFAHYAVKDTIQRGVGGLLHEEQNNYVRADKPGFVPKLKSAAENTFWVKHRNSNKRYPAVGRLSGDFGSGLISRLWQPASLHTVSSGLASGGISVGADFGWNLAREYMPPHRNKRVTVARKRVAQRRKHS